MQKRFFVYRIFLFWLIAIIIMSLYGCDQWPLYRKEYTIGGRVEEAGTGQPLAGIKLHLSGGFDPAVTEADGTWVVPGVWGDVTVTPVAEGWEFTPARVTLSSCDSDIVFVGVAPYTVTGKVFHVGACGSEYEICGVKIAFSGEFGTVTTGDDGTWSKSNLHGPVQVWAYKEGWHFLPGCHQVKSGKEINFRGEYGVGGRVVNTEGDGIAAALVILADETGNQIYRVTEQDGTWTGGGLQGEYRLSIQKTGWEFTPTSITVNGPVYNAAFIGEPLVMDPHND